MITKRFKKAVKECVKDGELSSEERELLKKIIKEDNISEVDAEVYITGKLKEAKKRQKSDIPDTIEKWGKAAAPLLVLVPILVKGAKKALPYLRKVILKS